MTERGPECYFLCAAGHGTPCPRTHLGAERRLDVAEDEEGSAKEQDDGEGDDAKLEEAIADAESCRTSNWQSWRRFARRTIRCMPDVGKMVG